MQSAAESSYYPDDIQRTAWAVAARHLTRGQKDVTKMIAEAVHMERQRCLDLIHAALGPEVALGVFVADPDHEW